MHLCQGDALLTGPQDPPDCQKQLKKKQKNRVAAQRSRQKHTDKADALHQHESLEKHNRTLQKEIQALQAELERWTRTLQLHQRLCRLDCASHPAPGSAGCWGQAEQPPGQPAARGQHGCRKQQGLLQSPAASPPAHTLDPGPHPQDSPGLLPPLLPVLPLGPAVVTVPPAQPSPRPDLSASPTGSGLLETFSKLSAILPSPPAQPAPPQPLGLEHPTRGDLGSSSHHASAAPGPAFLQRREQKPVRWAADWPAPAVEPSPHPLLAFPLLSSAQVHF